MFKNISPDPTAFEPMTSKKLDRLQGIPKPQSYGP